MFKDALPLFPTQPRLLSNDQYVIAFFSLFKPTRVHSPPSSISFCPALPPYSSPILDLFWACPTQQKSEKGAQAGTFVCCPPGRWSLVYLLLSPEEAEPT